MICGRRPRYKAGMRNWRTLQGVDGRDGAGEDADVAAGGHAYYYKGAWFGSAPRTAGTTRSA